MRLATLLLVLFVPATAVAQERPKDPPGDERAYEATTRARRERSTPEASRGRSGSRVERQDLEERLPRSSPDALRYEPGVYVQQTAHGQGSVYIRGLTGQQTVIVFDDVRMNTSLYRQGPNQYFFTIDSLSLEAVEVLRGSASVPYGSDALGGVLLAHPLEPRRIPRARGLRLWPRARGHLSTAEDGGGFRLQLEGQLGERLTAVLGGGYRSYGLLEGGGVVRGLDGDPGPMSPSGRVPLLLEDERTMHGTGFDELTLDGRVSYRIGRALTLTTAAYAYRQYDAPRTDQCPAPFAPPDECLTFDEQFHTLATVALRGRLGPLRDVHVGLSYQRQHERRTRTQPQLFATTIGRDDVDTFGLAARVSSPSLRLAPSAFARSTVGMDVYHDSVASRAWLIFTDLGVVRPRPRGQYLDGGSYTSGGVFGQLELRLGERLVVRAGARGALADASAPADGTPGSRPLDQTYGAFVSRISGELLLLRGVWLLANVDEGFRAPNLDDLTARQQTGPGFQFENPDLRPERSRTVEAGIRVVRDERNHSLGAEAWVFRTAIQDKIVRYPSGAACPPDTRECAGSWSVIQLVNAPGEARLHGLELAARLSLPSLGLRARASLSWATGDVRDPSLGERVPLSRVPPLNGSLELRWSPPWLDEHLYVGAATRWALEQTRLAPEDLSDGRIPPGGTPGYAVLDLRAGLRLQRYLVLHAVVENVADAAYRVHGSSVNGAGRGLVLSLEGGL